MAVGERDGLSGHMTTGHEWNGIKELNTPVPKPVWFFLWATLLFSIGYWVLMPAWPLGRTYTRGLLGTDQRTSVEANVQRSAQERSVWTRRIASMDYAAIQADPELMSIVRENGHRLFGDNCAACHGTGATGGPGFPNLVDRDWLWGGTPQAIEHTIRVGVNAPHPGTQVNQMLAFGRDGILAAPALLNVSHYVLALSDPSHRTVENRESILAGRRVFAENCVVCHGANGRGDQARGIPNLTDRAWIYGGDLQSILTSVDLGRQGEMPAWQNRLDPVDLKILALYVLDGGPRQR
jgi:cytochrome c oxidase cbb3-type subunit 3